MLNKQKWISFFKNNSAFIFLCGSLAIISNQSTANALTFSGQVKSGNTPIENASITLYQTKNSVFSSATPLQTVTSDATGNFSFDGDFGNNSNLLYVVSNGGSINSNPTPDSTLAAVLGLPNQVPSSLIINELSTAATAWSMNAFINGSSISGKPIGLSVANYATANLVDITTGSIASRLQQTTPSYQKFNTVANLLAGCVNGNTCNSLFNLATDRDGNSASNTLEVAVNLAKNPLNTSAELFALSFANEAYSEALPLSSPPEAWDIFLQHFSPDINGDNPFSGPGNIAIDKDGNLWITNNFIPDSAIPVGTPDDALPLPGNTLIGLDPGGNLLNGETTKHGGLYGAGFGIGIDPKNHIWVGNFGFGAGVAGPNKTGLIGNGNSVSRFDENGNALSHDGVMIDVLNPQPSGGFTQGDMVGPQGTVSDQQGNIWIASSSPGGANQSKIVLYLDGKPKNPNNPTPFVSDIFANPFDIAIDKEGNAWISFETNSNGGSSSGGIGGVVKLSYDRNTGMFTALNIADDDIRSPFGVAIDPFGYIWVSNNNALRGKSVSVLSPRGTLIDTYPLTSLIDDGPWGINADGNGNIYVAAFLSQRFFVLCGFQTNTCPQGTTTGDLISPADGYRATGFLERPTGLEIDSAGSLWIVNNFQTNFLNGGGTSILQYVGLAEPVKTPLIGPAQPLESVPEPRNIIGLIVFLLVGGGTRFLVLFQRAVVSLRS